MLIKKKDDLFIVFINKILIKSVKVMYLKKKFKLSE